MQRGDRRAVTRTRTTYATTSEALSPPVGPRGRAGFHPIRGAAARPLSRLRVTVRILLEMRISLIEITGVV